MSFRRNPFHINGIGPPAGSDEDSENDGIRNIRLVRAEDLANIPPSLYHIIRQQAMQGSPEALFLMGHLHRLGMAADSQQDDIEEDNDDDDDDDEANRQPCTCVNCTRLKCPVCSAVHDKSSHRHGSFQPRPEHQCSHGSTLLFIPADCPVCMEEKMDPPMVALACGHVLCVEDFKKMRGCVGVQEEPEEDDDDDDDEQGNELTPDEYRSFFFRMGRPPWMRDDEDDYDDEYDEDDFDDDDDMSLGPRRFAAMESEEESDDDDDDEMPPLVSRDDKVHRYPTRSRTRAAVDAVTNSSASGATGSGSAGAGRF